MLYKSNNLLSYYFFISVLICLCCCQDKKECSKFTHENYLIKSPDSILQQEARKYQNILLERFNETSIKEQNNKAYHLLFYSSHRFGKSIKFEQEGSNYYLSLKCILKKGWFSDRKDYKIKILKEDWDKLEEMIYEFNFWTVEQFKTNKDVLDGHVYFLEGKRPEAEKCNKRTYQFIGRGSPEYDKVGALCEYISDYEERLASNYGERKD